jgi:mRNA interferase RelE/StbE
MYKIKYKKQARKDLAKMPKNWQIRIREKLDELAINPYSINNNVKRIQGIDNTYRLRIGDYRAFYQIIDDELVISVFQIKSRGGAYKGL